MEKDKSWENVLDLLLKEIKDNSFKKDEKMPSENEMAGRFGVPRAVIRKVYGKLKEMGYIYSLQGQGSFFCGKREKIALSLTGADSFTEKMRSMNLTFESRTIECRKLPLNGNDYFYHTLEAWSPCSVFRLTRLRLIGGEPAAVHISYLSDGSFPHMEVDGSSIASLYKYMNDCGYKKVENHKLQMAVTNLSPRYRELLGLQSYENGLVLTGHGIDPASGRVIEISKTIYRCDRFIFSLS